MTLHGASHGAPLAAPALEDREHADREHEDREREDREEDAIPLRVVHEALGQHTWSEHPNRKAQCSHCEGLDAYECACGIRLCEQCRLPSAESVVGPSCSWRQHPTRPLPFYVADHAKWPDDEKLAWLRQEIGDGAELLDFAEKWLELFGQKFSGATAQKAA